MGATFEEINRKALRLAKEVAVETDTLMCGDISLTQEFDAHKPHTRQFVFDVFKVRIYVRFISSSPNILVLH